MAISSESQGSDIGADPSPETNRLSETERTVSIARLCASCDIPLTGRRRQAQFCSDRCRTQHRRRRRATRLAELVASVEQAVTALKTEIGACDE